MSSVIDNMPDFLVVPTNNALYKLLNYLEDSSLPNIDIEIILSIAIDGLIYKHSVWEESASLLDNVLNLDLSICYVLDSQRDNIQDTLLIKITSALFVLIKNVYNCLDSSGVYINDFLHYEFARIADNDSLLLRRVDR